MDVTNQIIKQCWYEKIGRVWHQIESYNKIGEHITILDLKDKNAEDIETVFCVRNYKVNVSIKFKDNTYFTFFVMDHSLYLDVTFEIINQKTIAVKIPLSWYTLTYSSTLIGKKQTEQKALSYKTIN